MNRLPTPFRVCLAAVSIVLFLAVPARSLPPTAPAVSHLALPIAGTTTSLFSDTIQWSGTIRLTVVVFPSDPVFPNDPMRVYSSAVDVVGLGDSGLTYRAFGTDTFSSSTPTSAFTQSYPVLVKGLPPSPILPPNPILPIDFFITFGTLGDVGFSTATIAAP